MTGKHSLVIVLSGGLDSTTLIYDAVEQGFDITSAVSFNYGQRHKKELNYAYATARRLGVKHHIIDLHRAGLTDALAPSGSSLVSSTEVPEGHYAEETMRATVVPNRNMIMLSVAGGIAVAEGAVGVATAVHAGDHFIYPDCRPEFIAHVSAALQSGNQGFGDMQGVWSPYIFKTKEQIAQRALELNLDLSKTWSCYKGGDKHCGKCGTCVERLEAIDGAAKHIGKQRVDVDSTEYDDDTFWIEAIEKGV